MARVGSTYRGFRRNACRAIKGVWPGSGVQLHPHNYKPVDIYRNVPRATTKDMWENGVRWIKNLLPNKEKNYANR